MKEQNRNPVKHYMDIGMSRKIEKKSKLICQEIATDAILEWIKKHYKYHYYYDDGSKYNETKRRYNKRV